MKNVPLTRIAKLALGWTGILLFRFLLLPFRPPNVEPLMAAVMPYSKRYGAITSFLFAASSIMVYDALTAGIGVWSFVAGGCYGLVAIAAHVYFASRDASVRNFLTFGVGATILYDAATGLTMGPIFFHVPFSVALAGQIPFTLLHLTGTILFATTLSPALNYWLTRSELFATAEKPLVTHKA